MKNPTIEEAMAYPWKVSVAVDPEGGFVGTVEPRLVDFSVHAETAEEVNAEWREALRAHLKAYLAVGKCVPVPYFRLQPQSQQTRGLDLAPQMIEFGERV